MIKYSKIKERNYEDTDTITWFLLKKLMNWLILKTTLKKRTHGMAIICTLLIKQNDTDNLSKKVTKS